MTKIDISKKLIKERLKLNFSVAEVGELAHYTRAYINQIENGYLVSLDTAKLIFNALGYNYDTYMDWCETEKTNIEQCIQHLAFSRIEANIMYENISSAETEIRLAEFYPNFLILKLMFVVIKKRMPAIEIQKIIDEIQSMISQYDDSKAHLSLFYLYYGVYLRNLEQYEKSIAQMKNALSYEDEYGLVNYQLGITYSQLGKLSVARDYCKVALEKFVLHGNIHRQFYALNHIATIDMRRKEYDASEQQYLNCITFLRSNHMEEQLNIVYHNLIFQYKNQKRYEEALSYCALSLIIDPSNYITYYHTGETYYLMENNIDSLSYLNQGFLCCSSEKWNIRFQILLTSIQLGRDADELEPLLLQYYQLCFDSDVIESKKIAIHMLYHYYKYKRKYKFALAYAEKLIEIL